MAGAEPLIRSTSLEGLDALLRTRFGCALGLLSAAVGIDPALKPDIVTHVPLRRFADLLELAAERTREECLGLAFAEFSPRGASGVLGYLVAHAPDLRTCIQCISRYVRLQIDALELDFVEEGGLARLTWRFDTSFIGPRKQLTEFVMALFVRRARQQFGEDWSPVGAWFEYREPRSLEGYHRIFGRQLRFDAGSNVLITRADLLSRRSATADNRLFKVLRRAAEKELEEVAQTSDVVAQVGKRIVEQLPIEGIDLVRAAGAMDMSVRQLQGRLRRHGTSFEAELGHVRRRLADRYLRETDMSMTDIALMLGFSELSSFTRAARTWFGMPPSAYRMQLRKAG